MAFGDGPSRPGRDRGDRGPRGFRRPTPKVCQFCVDKVRSLDYKEVDRLRQFVTEHGKIRTRRATGTCAFHQRKVAEAIKRARHVALLPYVVR